MRVFMLLLLLLAPAGYASGQEEEAVPDEQEEKSEPWASIYWDEGLHIHGPDKNFTINVGGMAQNDTAAFTRQNEDDSDLVDVNLHHRLSRSPMPTLSS